jgi:hypothetical protein
MKPFPNIMIKLIRYLFILVSVCSLNAASKPNILFIAIDASLSVNLIEAYHLAP